MLFQLSLQSGRLLRCFFFFSADPAVTSYLRRGRKGKSLIRYTFLVVCPSEHHLRKERSSAPSKWCSLENSRKERHGVRVKYTFVLSFAVTPQESDARVPASDFSIARPFRRDWCALSVSISICSSFSFSSCSGLLFSNGPYSPKGKKWRPRAPGGIMPR